MTVRHRPSARLVVRGVDLLIHSSGMPAVQIPNMTRREALAATSWGELVRKDSPPLVVQTREINEELWVTASREDLEQAVRDLYRAAKDGVIDDAAIRAFEEAAPEAWREGIA